MGTTTETEQTILLSVKKFEKTALLNIDAEQSTLPIDTSVEWNNAFSLVNEIIFLLGRSVYLEEFDDGSGKIRYIPKIPPLLLPFMQERRRLQDQIWKISGGEALMEGKKELYKKQADFIFQTCQDREFKNKHRKEVEKILEAEYHEVVNEN